MTVNLSKTKFINILLAGIILVIIGCGGTNPESEITSANTEGKFTTKAVFDGESRVLATNPMVAHWANVVTGTRATVESILPYSVDPHTYSPGAKDVAQIIKSEYIFAIGLMYEDMWLTEIIDDNPGIKLVNLGAFVSPIEFEGHSHGHGHSEDDEHSEGQEVQYDPHFWFDPQRVSIAVGKIAEVMAEIDPDGASHYQENAAAYKVVLDKLNETIAGKIDEIPQPKRKIISEHESLGYLGERYGIKIVGAVVPKLSTETGSTPKDMVSIIELIKEYDISVIFLERETNDKVAERVAEEIGIKVARGLRVESLEDGQSYVEFLKNNVDIIVSNLGD